MTNTNNMNAMANMFNDYAQLNHDEKQFVVGLANYDLDAENAAIERAKREERSEARKEFIKEHPVATAAIAVGAVAATALVVGGTVMIVKAAIEANNDGSCCDSAATAEGLVGAVM